jgi:hypothetical protein
MAAITLILDSKILILLRKEHIDVHVIGTEFNCKSKQTGGDYHQ